MARIADLPGSATALLDAFVAQLTAQGVDLPTDQMGNPVVYVAPGIGSLFAWDTACLALVFDSAQQGTPGAPVGGSVNVWEVTFSATFNLVLLRSVSGLNDATTLPTPDEMQADAAVTMTDAMALLEAAIAVKADPPEYEGRQLPFVIGSIMSVGPEGGLAGNVLQMTTVLA